MYKAEGTVVRVEGENAYIRASRKSSCGGCSKDSGSCGTSALLGFFERQAPLFKARNDVGAKSGEQVTIGLPETALLKGAATLYLPALLLLLAGAVGGHQFGELFSVIGAGCGLVVGYFWSRRQSARLNAGGEYRPVVLSRASHQFVVNFYGDHQ